MSLQKAVTIYIDCLESPPNGNGRHYVESGSGDIFFSEQLLGSLYKTYGEDQANAELDRQFKERRRQSNERFGFTIIDRDGGDVYTSEAEYPTYKEAERDAEHMLCDLNQGSFEIWLDQED